nr:hypothetical protein [Tanacetum cinerariifolium]
MTRSSTKDLLTPFEEPERSEEEVIEAMGKPTTKEYMMKTREDYGSRIARPKFDDKAHFELKGQSLKELRVNTFSGWDNEDANEHIEKARSTDTSDGLAAIQAQLNNIGREIKKVNERVYAAHVGRYRAAAPGFYQRDSGNPSYQERRQTMKESLNKFMAKFAKRHDENYNLIKEIRAVTDAASRNQGASIKALEIQIRQIRKVLQEKGSGSLPSSTETNLRDHVKSISTTIETKTPSIRRIEPVRYAALKSLLMDKPRTRYQIKAPMNMHDAAILEDALPPKVKDPRSFTIPCYINNICFEKALADLGASVSVMPYSTFTNLGLGELTPTKFIIELADRTIKCPKGIAENVLVGIDKFVFPVDFIVLNMPEDIKVSLILGRPFFSTTHTKIDVFKIKFTLRVEDDKIMFKNNTPTNSIIRRVYALGLRERMELDLEAWLMGKALILNRSLDPIYEDYIKLHDLNEPLELRRNQVKDLGPTIKDGEVIDKPIIEGKNVVEAFINVPIFFRNFSIMTDFAVVENMDACRDQGMGDVIVGKPFRREIYVKAKQFDGMITIYNGNDSVSAQDELNGISHPYQNLKSFYKRVLNLGPEYVTKAKIEEWLTRGHMSIHEME